MKNRRYDPPTSTFTLIEMLVVISIIAVLAALLMPGFRQAIDSAKILSCQNNLRQLSTVMLSYADSYHGNGPFGTSDNEANLWAADPLKGYLFPADLPSKSVISLTVCPATTQFWLDYKTSKYRAGVYLKSNETISSTYILTFGYGNRKASDGGVWYGWNANYLSKGTCPTVPAFRFLGKTYKVGSKNMTVRTASKQPMISDIAAPLGFNVRPAGMSSSNVIPPHPDGGSNTAFIDGHVTYSQIYDIGDHIRFYYGTARVQW